MLWRNLNSYLAFTMAIYNRGQCLILSDESVTARALSLHPHVRISGENSKFPWSLGDSLTLYGMFSFIHEKPRNKQGILGCVLSILLLGWENFETRAEYYEMKRRLILVLPRHCHRLSLPSFDIWIHEENDTDLLLGEYLRPSIWNPWRVRIRLISMLWSVIRGCIFVRSPFAIM